MIAYTFSFSIFIVSVLGIIYNEEPCYGQGGNCILASQCRNSASIRPGLCPSQASNVKCCVPYQESGCTAIGGLCKRTDTECSGTFISGKCPMQSRFVKCCTTNGEEVRARENATRNDGFEYDYAEKCKSGSQPGVTCLLKYMQRNSPSGRSKGIFNCRNIAGTSQKSLHSEGRALDWILHVENATEKAEAEHMIADFLADGASLAKGMGIQEIIFNRLIWSSSLPNSGFRPYTGPNRHTDYMHIGLNWKGARKETSFWRTYSC